MHENNILKKFLELQEDWYEDALNEIRKGRLEHYNIFYIFPHLRGRDLTEVTLRYGLRNIEEAKDYYEHPILGTRLIEATQLVLLQNRDIDEIFNYRVSERFRACMTLFFHATQDEIFMKAIKKFYNGNEDAYTLERL